MNLKPSDIEPEGARRIAGALAAIGALTPGCGAMGIARQHSARTHNAAPTPVAEAEAPGADEQGMVNACFDAAASYWEGIYEEPLLQGQIYRERERAVLAQVAQLELPAGASILEIGCGAGRLTCELAWLGHTVHAVDASNAMVSLAAERVRRAGLDARVLVRTADVHALPFAPMAFSLVVAVGVLPWLHSPEQALEEIARVLRPEGKLILTANNRARLNTLVDPRANVLLTPLKRLRRRLSARPVNGDRAGLVFRLHFPSHVNAMVRGAGFRLDSRATVGFGPFSFWGRPLLSDRAGTALHRRLQTLADRGLPILRSTGWHYLLSAHKDRALTAGGGAGE
jgi:ubiquinone/menaquinone biosynthesis C-methylase UbiE